MSIGEEILRLRDCKQKIKNAVNEKGGNLTDEKLSDYCSALDSISGIYFKEFSHVTEVGRDNYPNETWSLSISTGLNKISELHVIIGCDFLVNGIHYPGWSHIKYTGTGYYDKQEIHRSISANNGTLSSSLISMENGSCVISFSLSATAATTSQAAKILILAV